MKKFHDWHVYQICDEIFKPTESQPYRCIIRDNHFDNYENAEIICCCHPEHCNEAYQKANEFKIKRIKGKKSESFL